MLQLLAGCAVGPDYVKPAMELPSDYREAAPWTTAQPAAADDQSQWWTSFQDPVLNDLVDQANLANQTIAQSEAQYREALALADAARAGLTPTVSAGAATSRARSSGAVATAHSVSLSSSWVPDLWGGVRRSVEAGDASARASGDDLAAARLSIQSSLVQDYVQLRALDMQSALYARTTAAYQRSLQLVNSQYREGVALRSDLALAENQLAAAEAEALDLHAQRAQLEHAIAVLTGQPPAKLQIAALPADAGLRLTVPAIPATLPAQLLERRPDIAAAERRVAAANANIGVARAAWFPALSLSAGGGYSNSAMADLFNTPSRIWSLGAALSQTLFDGGLRKANDAQAIAAYDVTVASYKQTVLSAFQEVEDNLATLSVLDAEIAKQQQATDAAKLAQELALKQYRAGTATYLTVVTAQATTLAGERTVASLLSRRLVASAALITGLGGNWHAPTL
ncbi:efflux transporter outer membrane subunit [Duganella guangzhouensis]|uniref:efflux transporter outer membrane subunit n=1 Tax=Duganella guangzhouensis TaxID=2666084 RepID=UPI001E52537B|nr:efflux transporter outer membrane subunit [Duganella guangzhouensis]